MDGGNFCASEVTEYSKRLEKLTQQVTTTEQSLSTELKTVEPKKADQIAKIITDFQDRFRLYGCLSSIENIQGGLK